MIYPGSQLGPYLIDRELGRGGMALVYHALDERTGGEVALKVLAPVHVDNPASLRRFQQEGETALRLRHPNIVRAHDVGVLEGHHYIALDYAARGTLATLVEQRQEPIALNETVQLLRRVALALDYAHSRNLLHRDVKPSNILIGPNNQIWLADFGIARHLDKAHTTLTPGMQTIGTPAFMSPEQIRHDAEIDGRSDIYSLGVVAYHLLTGSLPFEAKTQVTLLHRIAYDPPTPPQKHNPDLPPGTCFVLERVLAKDPDARYNTAAFFIDALANSPHQLPPRAEWARLRRAHTPAPEPEPFADDTVVYQPERNQLPPPVRRREQRRFGQPVGWLIALGGLAAVIVAILLWSTSRPTVNVATELDATSTAGPGAGEESLSAVTIAPAQPLPSATGTQETGEGGEGKGVIPPTATLVPEPGATPPAFNAASLATVAVRLAATPSAAISRARAPTSTPVLDNTSTPTGAPTPTRAGQTPVPTKIAATTATQATNITVQLIFPPEDDTATGSRSFQWQASESLTDGYTFEPIFWPFGGDPMVDGRGWGGNTPSNSLTIDLTKFLPPGEYRWGVRIVTVNPYKPIQLVSDSRRIVVHLPGSPPGSRNDSPLRP